MGPSSLASEGYGTHVEVYSGDWVWKWTDNGNISPIELEQSDSDFITSPLLLERVLELV